VTGAYLSDFVSAGSGGLNTPVLMTFTETDPVTLAYRGGAAASTDHNSTSSILTFAPGQTSKAANEPRGSISAMTKYEGKNNQTTLFPFTIILSAAYDQPVTLSFGTINGTAKTSNRDYVVKAGTLIFAPGETTKTITIEVKGDSKREANETFSL